LREEIKRSLLARRLAKPDCGGPEGQIGESQYTEKSHHKAKITPPQAKVKGIEIALQQFVAAISVAKIMLSLPLLIVVPVKWGLPV